MFIKNGNGKNNFKLSLRDNREESIQQGVTYNMIYCQIIQAWKKELILHKVQVSACLSVCPSPPTPPAQLSKIKPSDFSRLCQQCFLCFPQSREEEWVVFHSLALSSSQVDIQGQEGPREAPIQGVSWVIVINLLCQFLVNLRSQQLSTSCLLQETSCLFSSSAGRSKAQRPCCCCTNTGQDSDFGPA